MAGTVAKKTPTFSVGSSGPRDFLMLGWKSWHCDHHLIIISISIIVCVVFVIFKCVSKQDSITYLKYILNNMVVSSSILPYFITMNVVGFIKIHVL